jgi:hypothetical protein
MTWRSSAAEFIFLKDGNIISGKISSDSADFIVLKKPDGQFEQVNRKLILRTIYTNLNMSNLYVQKRDGGSFVGYLVDEDRDVYIFRKELYKPEEFSVPRKNVLFMSEKNPSALKGDPSTDSVELSWLPPYGQVKYNKIYMKLSKEDNYKTVGTTKKNNINITGLESQKTYFFIVRAVDDTDYETNPSNEIQVITKSSLPDPPDVHAGKDDKENWILKWDDAKDKDGKVEGYRVYLENKGVYALLEETKKNISIVPKDAVFDSVYVRSIDNNGDESEAVDYRNDWRFIVSPRYVISIGKMTDFAGTGYGADLDISRRDILFNDFELGLTGGYLQVEGKEKIGQGNSNVTSLTMYPVALFTAYRISFWFNKFGHYDIISFFPKVSGGVMVMQLDYELLDNAGSVDETKSATVFEPFVKAGFFAELGVSRNFFFIAGCEYSYMVDSIQGLGMLNFSASAGFRF